MSMVDKKIETLLKIKKLRDEGKSLRKISKELGYEEAWAGVFWRRNKGLLDIVEVKPDTPVVSTPPKMDTPDTKEKVNQVLKGDHLRAMYLLATGLVHRGKIDACRQDLLKFLQHGEITRQRGD